MPVFTVDRPRTKIKAAPKPDKEQLEKRIKEKVHNFNEYMTSGNYHANGGCSIPSPNDGGDCPPC